MHLKQFLLAAAVLAASRPALAYESRCDVTDLWPAQDTSAARFTSEPAGAVVPAAPAASGPSLEDEIDAFIKGMRRRGLLQHDERTAWSVYDISRDVELAGINQDTPLQTASLIKPFIALAYFDSVAAGERSYTPQARRRMEAMIKDSDNRAADWFLRELGGPAAVQRRLMKGYGAVLSGLSLVEYIPANGRTFRNKASVHDYTRFLHELWADALPASAEIKRVMQLPKRNRLRSGAKGVPSDTLLYDKTGSTSRLCGDMGILVAQGKDGRNYPYILVGVIEKGGAARHYMRWIHRRGDLIRQVSSMAYKAIAARYGLAEAFTAAASR